MGGYRTVVAGTDGSASSLRAVERAASVAVDANARLVLVCAYRPADDIDRAQDELGADVAYQIVGSAPAEDTLRRARDRARASGAVRVETFAVRGDAADALRQVADEQRADLLVVGNRGLNTIVGRLLGSVPAEVARRAGIDVLIVHTT